MARMLRNCLLIAALATSASLPARAEGEVRPNVVLRDQSPLHGIEVTGQVLYRPQVEPVPGQVVAVPIRLPNTSLPQTLFIHPRLGHEVEPGVFVADLMMIVPHGAAVDRASIFDALIPHLGLPPKLVASTTSFEYRKMETGAWRVVARTAAQNPIVIQEPSAARRGGAPSFTGAGRLPSKPLGHAVPNFRAAAAAGGAPVPRVVGH